MLNIKKSNFVIFRPYQKKLNVQPNIKIYDNSSNSHVSLENKHVKYLGILIDCHLTWKYHIDCIATKISRTIGIIAKRRHFLPQNILITIYRSLIQPYLSYGLCVATGI